MTAGAGYPPPWWSWATIDDPMVPDLTRDQLDLQERHVNAFLHFSDPARVAAVAAKFPVLSDHALRHHQRRELDLWAFNRGRGQLAACTMPRYSRDARIAGAIIDAVLGKSVGGVDAELVEKQLIGPGRSRPRALFHHDSGSSADEVANATRQSTWLGSRAPLAEVPRLAAIFDAADAALNDIEQVLTLAGLSTNEREAARIGIVEGLQVSGALADAKARADRKLRRLATDSRKLCPSCGRWFDWQRNTAVYCSARCRLRSYRAA
jgi:hypothetical protein